MPLSCLSQYSPVNARSVPFFRSTRYCSGVSSFFQSSSVLLVLSLMVVGVFVVVTGALVSPSAVARDPPQPASSAAAAIRVNAVFISWF